MKHFDIIGDDGKRLYRYDFMDGSEHSLDVACGIRVAGDKIYMVSADGGASFVGHSLSLRIVEDPPLLRIAGEIDRFFDAILADCHDDENPASRKFHDLSSKLKIAIACSEEKSEE